MALDLYGVIIYPLIYILPAYAANAAPVLFGGGAALDMGRKFRGRRIFGSHKTVRGTASGVVAAAALGIAYYIAVPSLSFMLPIAAMMGVGAMLGDLAGSFLKRQAGIKPGASALVMDQYGFFVFAVALSSWLGHIPDLNGLVFLVVATGLLHVGTNRAAHMLRLKKVPW